MRGCLNFYQQIISDRLIDRTRFKATQSSTRKSDGVENSADLAIDGDKDGTTFGTHK